MKVKFFDLNADKPLKYAVICARYNGKWVFCKHKERDTYEIPGVIVRTAKILKQPQSVNFGKKRVQKISTSIPCASIHSRITECSILRKFAVLKNCRHLKLKRLIFLTIYQKI